MDYKSYLKSGFVCTSSVSILICVLLNICPVCFSITCFCPKHIFAVHSNGINPKLQREKKTRQKRANEYGKKMQIDLNEFRFGINMSWAVAWITDANSKLLMSKFVCAIGNSFVFLSGFRKSNEKRRKILSLRGIFKMFILTQWSPPILQIQMNYGETILVR